METTSSPRVSPEFGFVHFEFQNRLTVGNIRGRGDSCKFRRNSLLAAAAAAGGFDFVGDGTVELGLDEEGLDVRRRTGFHPDGLPDAACVAVALLAVSLASRANVGRGNGDDVVTFAVPDVRYVKLKLRVAAAVTAERLSIYCHFIGIVHRAEAEENLFACGIPLNGAAVEAGAVLGFADAGERGAPRIGDFDGGVVSGFVKREIPRPVEVQPFRTGEILKGEHCFGNHRFAPFM